MRTALILVPDEILDIDVERNSTTTAAALVSHSGKSEALTYAKYNLNTHVLAERWEEVKFWSDVCFRIQHTVWA